MNGKRELRSCALIAATLLVAGFEDGGLAAQKDSMADYGAPVRVRVKKPVRASEICPTLYTRVPSEHVAVTPDGKVVYDGKQMEVRQTVVQPTDELPAWECVTCPPRMRPLEGPHGRVSAGIIFRDYGNVEFNSRSMLGEDLKNERYEPPGFPTIKPGGLFEVDQGEYWSEDVDAGGPYIAFDLLFPICDWFRIGQQTSFSYSKAGASNKHSNLSGELHPDIADISGRASATMRNSVFERLDAEVYTISLGPLAEFHTGPVFFQGGLGLAMNIVNFNADVEEKLYIDSDFNDPVFLDALTESGPAFLRNLREDNEVMAEKWEDGNHGTRFLLGFYLQGLLGLQLSECWSLAGFARYDWNDRLEGEVGYSHFSMDLSAFSAGAQLGFNF